MPPRTNSAILRSGGGRGHLTRLRAIINELPVFHGDPITVETRKSLQVRRGQLMPEGGGSAVHAASDIRGRRILLERALLKDEEELRRIFTHELFHFVWVRLSNPARRGFEDLLHREMNARARGELGWSAEMHKAALTPSDAALRTRKWREYVCESFCDTAGWWFGNGHRHPEFTLARRFQGRRAAWYRNFSAGGRRIAL